MNNALVMELYQEIDSLPIVDIHTHVQWQTGTAANIGEILSYHYYTELTNSAEYSEGRFPFDDSERSPRYPAQVGPHPQHRAVRLADDHLAGILGPRQRRMVPRELAIHL
jgi:GrpB-like predicted nucleotidyltransferase (UPF0157 family)